jgi:hypothetical protein
MYDTGGDDLFDIGEARTSLIETVTHLRAECEANKKLQRKFDRINLQFRVSSSIQEKKPMTSAARDTTTKNNNPKNISPDLNDRGNDGNDSEHLYESSDSLFQTDDFNIDEAFHDDMIDSNHDMEFMHSWDNDDHNSKSFPNSSRSNQSNRNNKK